MKTPILRIICCLILIACLLPGQSVNAAPARPDMAPPPVPGVGGLSPFEYQSTNVEMIHERVEMEIQDVAFQDGDTTFHQNQIGVTAWFVMRNTGKTEESMQVIFPLDDFNRCIYEGQLTGPASYTFLDFRSNPFTALVDDMPAEVTQITTKHPRSGSCEGLEMRWAAFNVTFPVGQDVLVRVSYAMSEMRGSYPDEIQNVSYILETGAGWKGPIREGVVVFRFPYQVEDNLISGTSPNYQVMQNEIYWTFKDLEPTQANNLIISYIAPHTWRTIKASRLRIAQNPQDAAAWAALADAYWGIGHIHGPNVREESYAKKADSTYRKGLEANPNSADLAAGLADALWTDCCFYYPNTLTGEEAKISPEILPLVQRALNADPNNPKAWELYSTLKNNLPDLTYVPPATLEPTLPPTPTLSPTDAVTTELATPTSTPTRIPTLAPTSTPRPTRTPAPTRTATLTPAKIPAGMQTAHAAAPTQVAARSEQRTPYAQIAIGVIAALVMLGLFAVRKKTWD